MTPWALRAFDDGGGPALYAGGSSSPGVKKWDGSNWSVLGSGLNSGVEALAVFDNGSGAALYAGGPFTTAGGGAANRIAKWNGSSWSALGSGVSGYVFALTSFDDGNGVALYVGGNFAVAGGAAAKSIAKWSGSGWSALGSGVFAVLALTVFDFGGGEALYVGGTFPTTIDSGDSYLAKWGCPDTTPPVLSCPPSVLAIDSFSGPPGEVVTFSVTATDDHDPSPSIVCVPPSGSFFPRGTTLVNCTATDASGNQSVCQFPVSVELKVKPRKL